ncbi:hypothetical protein MTO96_025307 [Rhipicephalus appendiculatus]
MKEELFFKLLKSCPGLRELEIDKDELTTTFLVGPPESCGERPMLAHVERLTLRTSTDWYDICTLDEVEDLPSDLDSTLSCLPSLRRVRTDNYDIRLHINSCFPNIALDWCTCTVCASEFPKMNEVQRSVYACTQQLKLQRPIEYVHINSQDKTRYQLKAEVSVYAKKEELKVEEVAVDTKDKNMKSVEDEVDIKDEKIKAEVLFGSKGEEVNAEVPVEKKEKEIKAEAPEDPKKKIVKAKGVPVDINDKQIKADEVPVDAKEGELKHKVPVDTEEEKLKAEDVPANTKDDKGKAVASVRTKEEVMKAETPVDPYKAVVKLELVLLDAKGEEVKAEDVNAYIMQKKVEVEFVGDNKEKKMTAADVLQAQYEARMRKASRRREARRNKIKEHGIGTGDYIRISFGVDVTMGLQELILEAMKELGDPDEVVNNEDLIVLKLKQACTNKRILPEDIALSGDARRLSMSQQAFVSRRAFLGNLRYSAALFAGCGEFLSSKAFFETAKYVLKNVRTLVIVHNRNSIFNLVTWFPTVTTIVLYHNLRLHAETGVITSALPLSRMEELLGTMPALGLDRLFMSTDTLQSLFQQVPQAGHGYVVKRGTCVICKGR